MKLKKGRLIAGIIAAALLFALFMVWRQIPHRNADSSGSHQKGKNYVKNEDKSESGTENEEDGDSNQKQERIIVDTTDYASIDNTLYAWWFKRNDNHEKSGCQEDFDITQYQAYYTVPVNEKKIYITFDCG